MQFLIFILTFPFLWLISILPFRIFYWFSDFIYIIVYYIIGYRKKIVLANLLIAFPEKTEKERIRVAKNFYHNLIDTFIESVKFISISKKQIQQRSTGDFELVNDLIAKGYNIHMMAGHQFNWEYGNALYSMKLSVPFVGIYMPISNKHLDRIFFSFRKKYGTILIPATEFKNKMHHIFSKQYTLGLTKKIHPIGIGGITRVLICCKPKGILP